jgi:mannose-1-phosphate guanylyltransferase
MASEDAIAAVTAEDQRCAVQRNRWAVILAGGDGTRLQRLTRFICGDDRPKQFCPILDGYTLLAHTVRRAERSISTPQILFALTRTHREFYVRELGGFERQRIVQPSNKGTAPAILFSVLSIERLDDDALVAILPSDHYYSDETRFTRALESAFEIAAGHPESVVLLGAQPDCFELEYGWIELGPRIANDNSEVRRVCGFWEKPSLEIAQALLGRGDAVWNTFVMVGHVRAFLEIIARAIPGVLHAVRQSRLWTGSETHIDESVYSGVTPSDFSRRVLSVETARLVVLPARDLGWSDLGHPGRVLAVLENGILKPEWVKEWRQGKQAATVARLGVRSAVA